MPGEHLGFGCESVATSPITRILQPARACLAGRQGRVFSCSRQIMTGAATASAMSRSKHVASCVIKAMGQVKFVWAHRAQSRNLGGVGRDKLLPSLTHRNIVGA
jgi:hypothetical protein